MSEIELPLDGIPEILSKDVVKAAQHFVERCPDYVSFIQQQVANPEFARHLSKTWACSNYAKAMCLRRPALLQSPMSTTP